MNAIASTPATQAKKSRPKPPRSVRVIEQPTEDTDGWGAIEITITHATKRTTRNESTVYLVHFVASEFGNGGIGFEVEKIDADLNIVEQYQVHLSDRPADCFCDCKGCERWNHCKHVEALAALRKAGKLPEVPRFRSGGDAKRNDPIALEEHLRSIADPEGPDQCPPGWEYPDEPPQLPEHADFDPATDL